MAKLTDKQEGACLVFIETGNKSKAYRANYDCDESKPETIWNEAYLLFNNPDVAKRVDELRAEHAERHNVTIDSLTLEFEQATNIAAESNQASAMVAAITAKAKVHGLITDKTQHKGAIGFVDLSNKTDEELQAILNES